MMVLSALPLIVSWLPGDGLFPARQYEATPDVQSLVAADLDGDGWAELVGVDLEDDVVVLLEATGPGAFLGPRRLAEVPGAFRVHVAELTGDGIDDLLVLGSELGAGFGTLVVLRGLGDASFEEVWRATVPFGLRSALVLDVDADGDRDLVLAHFIVGTGLSVLLGLGDGSFGPPLPQGNLLGAIALAPVDLGGDSLPDLAVAEFKPGPVRRLWFLENQGGGAFATNKVIVLQKTPVALASADLDADGLLDVALTTWGLAPLGGLVRFYHPDGAGSFTEGATVRIPFDTLGGVRLEDVDGDGVADLILCNPGFGRVVMRFGVAGTLFKEELVELPRLSTSCDLHDFDGDGDLDLVQSRGGKRGFAEVVFNHGGRSFLPDQNVLPPEPPRTTNTRAVELGDVDGDGHLDVVLVRLGTAGYEAVVVRGNGDGSFALPKHHPLPMSAPAERIEVGDLDADGLDDVVVCSTGLVVYRAIGGGKLGPPSSHYPDLFPQDAAIADLVGDERPELAVALPLSSEIVVLAPEPGGPLVEAARLALPRPAWVLEATDLDGDGTTEMLTGAALDGTIGIVRRAPDGTLSFQTAAVLPQGFVQDLCSGDWDGDGIVDVAAITVTFPSMSEVSVLRGAADGTLTVIQRLPFAGEPYAIAAADVDADGLPDLIVSDAGVGNAAVHLNAGGHFAPPMHHGVAITNTGLTAGSLDGIGPPDLVFASDRFTAVILRNQLP